MTKDEAIKYLQQLYSNGGCSWLDEQRIEAISMAVDALKDIKCEGCNNVRGCPNCVDGDQWAHYEVNKELEDEAEEYVFGFHPSIQRMCKEAFIEGAEWNREKIFSELGYQINSNYDAGYKKGARDKEKEMITRAIAWVEWNNRNGSCLFDGWKESLREAMEGE